MSFRIFPRLTVLTAVAVAAASGAPVAWADAWPSKPIKIVVPFTPGSGTDTIGRTIGERLAKVLGQPVIIENKPGAGGTIGASQVEIGRASCRERVL